jgi:SAM-dependent methyltransferase
MLGSRDMLDSPFEMLESAWDRARALLGDGQPYDAGFYDRQVAGSIASAEVAVPLVMDLVRPASVVDLGCGLGAWLASFASRGVRDVLGLDGDYVDRSRLLISVENFRPQDLTAPVDLDRRFDLAISVEVAEHLPATAADTFVASLTALAPVVLFGAAIPFQGGSEHVNEQWPAYWAERFARHGYRAIDVLREKLWNDDRVRWWYAQNLLLYASDERLAADPRLAEAAARTPQPPLALVHPKKYLLSHTPALRVAARAIDAVARRAQRLRRS